MISKELLSDVLGKNITGFLIEEGVLFYSEEPNKPPRWETWVNIHELAHKCKEWAVTQGYSIDSCVGMFNKAVVAVWDMNTTRCATRLDEQGTTFETEPEAIFKACEWIREQL